MLVRYDTACRAIAEARSVDEVKSLLDGAAALRAYARQAKNKTLEADAFEIRMRAERRVGQLIAAQKASVGLSEGTAGKGRPPIGGSVADPPKDPRPTLAEAGIDKHLADRARKLTKAAEDEFERKLVEARARILETSERVRVDLFPSGAHVGKNSGDNEWFTPAAVIAAARQVLGEIDLDPASTAAANRVVQARQFFTQQDDGLKREWKGRVWMNPPYAAPLIDRFAQKLADAIASGAVSAAVVLVNNATETAWFHTITARAQAMCLPRGRVKFWHPDKPTATPLQGQAVIYSGPHARR